MSPDDHDTFKPVIYVNTWRGAIRLEMVETNGDIVRGVGRWPGHKSPIRFWTDPETWTVLSTPKGLLAAARPLLSP